VIPRARRTRRRLGALAVALAAAGAAFSARPAAAQAPLFRTDSVLAVTLRADLRTLFRDRDTAKAQWHPATLRYAGPDGAVTVPARVRTRGIFRRATCDVPPLRLRFEDTEVRGTLLAHLRHPKLVTHCYDRDEYEQNLLQEYAIYRLWRLFTPYAFAARLVRVTYEDSTGRLRPVTRYGIITEDPERLAQRLGATLLEQNDVRIGRLRRTEASLLGVFQYLIGNTDWGVPTRHNVALLRTADSAIYAVPYDFDWSGIIDARYARPAPFLHIQRVTERVFRGVCQPQDDLVPTLLRFEALRDSLAAVYRSVPDLQPRVLAKALRYIDTFYADIADHGRFWRREIEQACMW
jgi:hypothetical protein